MFTKPSQALLMALALIAGPAFAQDAPLPTEPEAPAEAPVPTQVPADAPATQAPASVTQAPGTAEATPDPERPGTYYTRTEHADWAIRCIRAGQGKDPCEMYKLLSDEDDNAVAELTIVPLSNGEVAAGATLVAPLETDLIEGLGFQVDGGEMRGYPFSFCAPVGCISRLGFTDTEVAAMKGGQTASVQLLPFGADPENPVQLDFSLSGFTAAFDELTAYAAEPAPEAEAEAPADAAEEEPAPAE